MNSERNLEHENTYPISQWTTDDIPQLCRLEAENWKPWLADGEVALCERMDAFPEGQLLLRGPDNTPIASLSTNRISWSNPPDIQGLPPSWDYCAGKCDGVSFRDVYHKDGNTLVILVMNVSSAYKGKHIPSIFINQLRKMSQSMGFEYIVGPFRPSQYGEYKTSTQELSFVDYCNMRREDGERVDAWLRAVERNGGVFFGECKDAMNVGPIEINEVIDPDWIQVTPETYECMETGQWSTIPGTTLVRYTESNMWGGFGIEQKAPTFPDFRPLQLTDKSWIEKLTRSVQYHHCDMQFYGRWIWGSTQTRIAESHGNLVFELPHGYSFIGNGDAISTIEDVFAYQKSMGTVQQMVCIPAENLQNQDEVNRRFNITEDRNLFDYVYSIGKIAELSGGEYAKQRSKSQRFIRDHPNVEFHALSLASAQVQSDIHQLYAVWRDTKNTSEGEINEEKIAIDRLLQSSVSHRIVAFGLYDRSTLIGFAAGGVADNEWIMSYFRKADASYHGIYQYLEHMTARALHKQGFKYMNREYDMGLPGLRESKMSWRPVMLLRKLALSPRDII